jgi:hypothetical protein
MLVEELMLEEAHGAKAADIENPRGGRKEGASR